uniref:Uncharacterized protein n=1 Tax=Arundo donax TaxID=35708 RepID=A0A0A9AFX9_ARUDO
MGVLTATWGGGAQRSRRRTVAWSAPSSWRLYRVRRPAPPMRTTPPIDLGSGEGTVGHQRPAPLPCSSRSVSPLGWPLADLLDALSDQDKDNLPLCLPLPLRFGLLLPLWSRTFSGIYLIRLSI